MQKLETQLDDLLVKKAPFQIPENGRQALVKALPWLTLIGGVLMLWASWALWQLMSWADRLTGVANQLDVMYGTGYTAHAATASPLLWVSLVLLLAEAVLFFAAFPALRDHKKKGWDILFWVSMVNAAQAIVQAIAYTDFGSMLFAILGSAIGLYLLFQIRPYYTGEKVVPAAVAPPTASSPKPPVAPPTPKPPATTTTPQPETPSQPEKKV